MTLKQLDPSGRITLQELEKLEQLAAKATPGPWINAHPHSGVVVQDDNEVEQTYSSVLELGVHIKRWQDLEFTAASREAVPVLCAALRESRQMLINLVAPVEYVICEMPEEQLSTNVERMEQACLDARAFLEKWEGK